jgi:glycosyltransferase involved in cell wall biosynthesis
VIDTPEVYPALREAGFTGALINEVHTTTANIAYLSSLHGERMSAFLAPSRYLCRRIEQEFAFAGEVACHRVSNCLDTAAFRPIALSAVPQRKVLLWVGKLDDHKNWRGFLASGRRLLDRRDDFDLWLAGGETAKDSVAEEMLDMARELKLLDRLRWLQRVEYRSMPVLYSLVAASGGLTVSTSCDESFGMTVAESLACGCPAAAAAVGALPEVLEGPLAAGLYPYFDLDALVATLERLLDDEVERERMARLGRASIVERFGIETAGRAYFETVRRVVDAASAAAGAAAARRAG